MNVYSHRIEPTPSRNRQILIKVVDGVALTIALCAAAIIILAVAHAALSIQ